MHLCCLLATLQTLYILCSMPLLLKDCLIDADSSKIASGKSAIKARFPTQSYIKNSSFTPLLKYTTVQVLFLKEIAFKT